MTGLYERFEASCARFKDKTAVICGENRVSYTALAERVGKFSRILGGCGVKKGTHVSLLCRNSPDMLCLYFALFRAGAVCSPLNYRENAQELARLAGYVDTELLIYDDAMAERLHEAEKLAGGSFRSVSLAQLAELPEGEAPETVQCAEGDIVLNIFTGGTTGESKAASHSYEGLAYQLESCYMLEAPVREDDVFLNYAPMFHIGGFTAAMQTVCAGGTFVISEAFKPAQLLDFVQQEGVTQLSLIPPSLCTELVKCDNFGASKLSSVRVVRMSGGACNETNVHRMFELFPNAKAFIGYGMSERAVNMVNIISRDKPMHVIDGNISVGTPGAFNECRLVDENGETVCRPGQIGEVYGRGPCTMTGYYKRDDSFDRDGWFATGDLMFFDEDGFYYFVDRKKNMIKSGGENVYSNLVEQIIRMHPSVKDCAVVGIPDERLGEMVAAAVVLRDGAAPVSGEELTDFCGKYTAGFRKARKIVFVKELPRSKIGKVKKSEVKALLTGKADG